MVEAERDAQALLAKAWKKEGPSGFYLPVDPFEIAMNLGIQVFTGRGLALEISGMLKKEAGYADPEILLNAADSRNRQRFICGHEVGHYTRQVRRGEEGVWDFVDGRDLLSSEEQDAEEVYANHFAAELLMPRHIALDRIGDSNVAALALDFGVSGDAMRFRLEHLDQC